VRVGRRESWHGVSDYPERKGGREGGRAYLPVQRTQRGGERGDAYPSSHQPQVRVVRRDERGREGGREGGWEGRREALPACTAHATWS